MKIRFQILGCISAATILCNGSVSAADKPYDHELVTASLLDLLENPETLKFDQTTETKGKIVFAVPEFTADLTSLTETLDDKEAFKSLPPSTQSGLREAATNLTQRAAAKDGYTTPTQLDSRILVYTESLQAKDQKRYFWERTQLFRPLPPGYSKDGNFAVVQIEGTWSGNMHGAIFLTMFTRRDGQWVKLARCDMFLL